LTRAVGRTSNANIIDNGLCQASVAESGLCSLSGHLSVRPVLTQKTGKIQIEVEVA
jgi:hypothetical protein